MPKPIPGSFWLRIIPIREIIQGGKGKHCTPKGKLGLTTGLGVTQYISMIFEINELLPYTRKLNDEQIRQQFVREFPGTRSAIDLANRVRTVGYWRTIYNGGRLTHGKVSRNIPERLSHRWTEDGRLANIRTGHPMDDMELAKVIEKEGKLPEPAPVSKQWTKHKRFKWKQQPRRPADIERERAKQAAMVIMAARADKIATVAIAASELAERQEIAAGNEVAAREDGSDEPGCPQVAQEAQGSDGTGLDGSEGREATKTCHTRQEGLSNGG